MQGILWWSSGYDSMLPVLRAQFDPLVRELRSLKPCGVAWKEQNEVIKKKKYLSHSVFLKKKFKV